MKLAKTLSEKKNPHEIHSIPANAKLREVGHRLCELHIGALLVTDPLIPAQYVGIVSTWDIITRLNHSGAAALDEPVAKAMTTKLIVATENDDVDYVLRVMVRHKIRQIPVIAQRQVTGVLSLLDLLRSIHSDDELRIQYMQDYLGGSYGNQVF